MKILIADDHELFRDGLRLVLTQLDATLEVVEAGDYETAIEETRHAADIDLILLDLAMPGMPWTQGLESLRAMLPDVPVIVLSAADDRRIVLQAVKMGAAGYIPKSSSSKVMMSALQLVLSGGVYLPPALLDQEQGKTDTDTRDAATQAPMLTPRQREVLGLLGRGKSNKEIARLLDLSEGTVKLHVTAILKALGVSNRTSAVVAASRLGLTALEHADGPSMDIAKPL